MKKIISACALASLAFGAAFADASLSLNYRTQGNIYATDTKNNMNSYLNQTVYGSSQDDVTIKATTDVAGVTFTVDPYAASSSTWALNEYSAFVTLGNWTVYSGEWKNGVYKISTDYMLKNDADACNLGGESWAAYKLGSIYKSAITLQVEDMTNFAGGSNTPTTYLQYTGFVGGVNLGIQAAAITSTYDSDFASGFGLKVDTKFKNWETEFITKTATTGKTAYGFYAMPFFIPKTNLTIGGTFGVESSKVNQYNFDLRARYVNGPLSITTMNNYSHMYSSSGVTVSKNVGAYDYSTFKSLSYAYNTTAGKWYVAGHTQYDGMWNLVAARYKINGNVYALGQVGSVTCLSDFDYFGMDLFVAPGIQFFPDPKGKTSIATCVRVGFSNIGVDDSTVSGAEVYRSVTIPCVIRVRF
jgi:hypothetical protein